MPFGRCFISGSNLRPNNGGYPILLTGALYLSIDTHERALCLMNDGDFLDAGERNAPETNCVAEDAVLIEPLSAVNSRLSGKKTGNSVNLGDRRRFAHRKSSRYQMVTDKFPVKSNREFAGNDTRNPG
jgi:hypothetical protein